MPSRAPIASLGSRLAVRIAVLAAARSRHPWLAQGETRVRNRASRGGDPVAVSVGGR